MSVEWAKNFVGLPLTEAEMANIPNATSELIIHVTEKTVQAGTFLGSLVVGPILQAIKGPRNLHHFQKRIIRYGLGGCVLGLIAGPAMTYGKIRASNLTEEEIFDRSFRLRHNRNQNNIDRSVAVGSILGLAARGLSGIVLGINAGLFCGIAINYLMPKKEIHGSTQSKE